MKKICISLLRTSLLLLIVLAGNFLVSCNSPQNEQAALDTQNTAKRIYQNDYAEPGLHFLVAKEAELKEKGQIKVKAAEKLISKHISPESEQDIEKESWFYRYEGIISIESDKYYQVSFGQGPMSNKKIMEMYAVDIFGNTIYTWTGDEWKMIYPKKKK